MTSIQNKLTHKIKVFRYLSVYSSIKTRANVGNEKRDLHVFMLGDIVTHIIVLDPRLWRLLSAYVFDGT
jgi:hypothetical protein